MGFLATRWIREADVGGALMLAAVAIGLVGTSHGLTLDVADRLIVDTGAFVVAITGLISALKAHRTQQIAKDVQQTVNTGVTIGQEVQSALGSHLQRVEAAYQGFAEQGKATVAALQAITKPLDTTPQAQGG